VPEKPDERIESSDEEFRDREYMDVALGLARQAESAREVPVGAIVVSGSTIIGSGFNSPIGENDPTAHAEMLAIRRAAKSIGNYRLTGSTIYVTLEPCAMCAGAMVHARVARLVFGARDLRFGGVRSKFCIPDSALLNHRLTITEGVRAADCIALLQDFFSRRRDDR
jgi:tRNA(adenine34) deaminase